MSTFTKNSITVQGAVAIAALVAGGTLEFTRIQVGDGELPANSTPMARTELVNPLFDVAINEVYSDSESQATVTGVFSNAQTQTGFFYRELGLFAKDPATGAEILYCYGNAGDDAEWISPAGSESVIEKEVHIVTLVGNATTVTATLKSGIYPTIEQTQGWLALKADLDATAAEGGRVLASQMRFDASQTLYVDAAATAEGADGSEAKPFKTIQAAINARYMGAPVIHIKIKPGTYAEDIQTPRAPDTTWRFERNGEGTVSVRNAIIDNAAFCYVNGLTFVGPAETNSTIVYVANTPSVYFNAVTITGTSTETGVNLSTSRGVFQGVAVNNCGIAIAATSGAYLDLRSTSGTGNVKGLHADGAIIVSDWYVPSATTPYEKVNGGAINVQGGYSSFPSNYSQMFNLGDFSDVNALKTAILTEFNRLGVGEALACWFANNIAAGFGPFGNGQRMQVQIIKSTDSGSGYGTALFTSHHNAARGYMQIQNGAFATDVPVKFADSVDLSAYLPLAGGTMNGMIETSGGQTFPALSHVNSGGQLWLFDKGDQLYKGGFIARAKATDGAYHDLEGRADGLLMWDGKNVVRSVNGYAATATGEVTIPVATSTTYGIMKAATDDVVIDEDTDDAAITPAVYHDVSDFRHKETTYAVGDKVECMFNFELFLECTQAGTTASTALDTRNVTHGQVITDGTVQWTVRTHIRSINGTFPDELGNINVDSGGVKTINGEEPDENGNITPEQTGCLPLSGGMMTGAISFSTGIVNTRNDTYKEIRIEASGNGKFGAGLFLRTADEQATDGAASFVLATRSDGDSSELGAALVGHADGELLWNNNRVPTLIDSWRSGNNWYRKWSDGFIEQGGPVSSSEQGEITITFNISFSNASSYVIFKNVGSNYDSYMNDRGVSFYSLTANSATTYHYSNYTASKWYACGY